MYLDTFYRIHLEWMFENQPSLVLKLLRTNKLKDHLDDKEQRALRMVSQMKEKHGLSEEEARDQAIPAWDAGSGKISSSPFSNPSKMPSAADSGEAFGISFLLSLGLTKLG